MKKLIALCLLALFLMAVPAMAAKPDKDTITDESYLIDGVSCTPVIVEVTTKETNSGLSVNRMYFSTDYVTFYGQELTLDDGIVVDIVEDTFLTLEEIDLPCNQ